MSRWKPSLMKDSFLCTLSFRKISVASRRCWFSKILGSEGGRAWLAGGGVGRRERGREGFLAGWGGQTHFFAFHAIKGRLRSNGSQ
jgi:hypothetical protein